MLAYKPAHEGHNECLCQWLSKQSVDDWDMGKPVIVECNQSNSAKQVLDTLLQEDLTAVPIFDEELATCIGYIPPSYVGFADVRDMVATVVQVGAVLSSDEGWCCVKRRGVLLCCIAFVILHADRPLILLGFCWLQDVFRPPRGSRSHDHIMGFKSAEMVSNSSRLDPFISLPTGSSLLQVHCSHQTNNLLLACLCIVSTAEDVRVGLQYGFTHYSTLN